MRPKIIILTVFFFALFILGSMYIPVVYKHHVEHYNLNVDQRMSVAFCGLIVWLVLLACCFAPIVYEVNRQK